MSTVAAATATKEVAADGVDKAKSKKSAGAKQVAAATGAAKPTAAMPQTERKTKEGHTLADLLKMKAPALKEMCAEANVGVTGKKEVLAERLLNPSKHQSFLPRCRRAKTCGSESSSTGATRARSPHRPRS